ncbi:site-2 protease family protein [Zavarzinia compransoris]|uniref:Site-2 protease family protein n=1 Tax=Zavarzinia compransoris TaxID=1264899 RepID=A0A317E9R5_9PROT|nr:site-2 protease family protein [Zavarzinia compransoris]PWR23659.1 site-2 protease family protein [Zavarzinia compransoris]TDP47877.1 Zn-dependent protease [Zavarzinia compransoris]
MNDFLQQVTVWALPIVFAITLHEAAHGWMANRLGDPTARMLGRVTLNPIRHIDPLGTIILPALLLLTVGFAFGYAKPVPINFRNLRNPRRDMVLVAAAGPGANMLMALIAAGLIHLVPVLPEQVGIWLGQNCVNAIVINAVLGVFNMIPLPPLDGGRVAVGLLPRALAYPLARVEPYGMLLIFGAAFLLPMVAAQAGLDVNPVFDLIEPVIRGVVGLFVSLAGLGL